MVKLYQMAFNLVGKLNCLKIQLENSKDKNFNNSITMKLRELEDIQRNLTLNPMDNSLWMQEKKLQDYIQHHALEYEI